MAERARVLIVGGGYVGLYTALRLQKKLRRRIRAGRLQVTVVEPQNHMTYQPFLPEAAAGSVEPRHVVVPLRTVLRRCEVITGVVRSVDHAARTAEIGTVEGGSYQMDYDVLVMAPGGITRTLPIPGLAEMGIGFKNIGEAIYLRNHVLSRLDYAASVRDPERRVRALTFVFVGGGYSGIEVLGELEDMARYATRYYPEISPSDLRFLLVEASDRILPEVSVALAAYTVERLTERGIDVRLNTKVTSMTGGRVELSDGDAFDSETVVWTAGGRASPMLANTDLPLDEKGRVRATADLRVDGVPDAWTAGDCAAVPDLTAKEPGTLCGPTAQHAVRQARRLADNVVSVLRGGQPKDYRHKYAGSVASLGLHKGVAEIYGVKLKGFPAWFMHRTYHVMRVPTVNRRVRVIADWTLALFFRREVVSLGQIQDPRGEFEAAASPGGNRLPTGT